MKLLDEALSEMEGHYDGAEDSSSLWLGQVMADVEGANAQAKEMAALLEQAVHNCEGDDEVWLNRAWVRAAKAAVKKAQAK